MNPAWQPLLANLAVIAVFTSFWTAASGLIERIGNLSKTMIFGLLCGGASVAVMCIPYEVAPGIQFDLRSVPVVIGGFFSGPFGGLIAACIAGGYRISLGGAGVVPGLVGIAFSLAVSLILHYQRRGQTLGLGDAADLGFANTGVTLLAVLALPVAIKGPVFQAAALPALSMLFLSMVLAATAIILEVRRREISHVNEVYRAIIDALPDCLNAKDSAGRFVVANPATAILMNAGDQSALIGKTDFDFYTHDTATEFLKDEKRIITGGAAEAMEQKLVREDGETIWLSTLKVPFVAPDSGAVGLITHNRDITEHKQLAIELAETRERLSDALTHMADGLVMFGADGQLVYCNNRFRTMFSIPDHIMLAGMPLRAILSQAVEHFQIVLPEGKSGAEWVEDELERVRNLESIEFELVDGRWFQNRHALVESGGWLTVFSDVTERKRAEQEMLDLNARLEVLARTDGLTGLMNRKTFDEWLYREFAGSQRHGKSLGLMLIDVDRFKAYNDMYGHPEGDACLQAIADCLKLHARRPPDAVARYGGEEFVAIYPDTGEAGMEIIAENFRQSVRALQRVHHGSEKGIATVSIGVAVFQAENDLKGPADLVRAADEALYRAKAGGRDCTRFADLPRSEARTAKAG